ncbi:MAG: alpha/beta fold hydrolase [Gammaproteobacteria bacterium]|nr:alpha/beta fold hydrolase [Gammaproteobacteria bacterium]
MNIVCIHGSGSGKESWHYQVRAFGQVHALDLPGHPDGELIPTIAGMADWLHGYVQDNALTGLVLCGHSLGGGVVLQYALDHPGSVRGLVLIGTGARLKVLPKTLDDLAQDVACGASFDAMAGYHLIEPAVAQVLARRRVENGLSARLNDLRACNEFDVMAELKSLTMPALAICGSDDVMTPPKYTRFLAERLPDARGVVIEGATHQVHLEKPEQVNAEIGAFLATL